MAAAVVADGVEAGLVPLPPHAANVSTPAPASAMAVRRDLVCPRLSTARLIVLPHCFVVPWNRSGAGRMEDLFVALRTLTAAFEWGWFDGDAEAEPLAIVTPNEEILDRAAHTTAVHGLRAYDAIQLATAVVARAADPDLTTFACFDERLADAARLEGFTTIP